MSEKKENKERMINSKTIKNMMDTLRAEANADVGRLYQEWMVTATKFGSLIDSFSSASLKRIIKKTMMPNYEPDKMSKMEEMGFKLLQELEDLKTEMFIVASFMDKPKPTEEETNE